MVFGFFHHFSGDFGSLVFLGLRFFLYVFFGASFPRPNFLNTRVPRSPEKLKVAQKSLKSDLRGLSQSNSKNNPESDSLTRKVIQTWLLRINNSRKLFLKLLWERPRKCFSSYFWTTFSFFGGSKGSAASQRGRLETNFRWLENIHFWIRVFDGSRPEPPTICNWLGFRYFSSVSCFLSSFWTSISLSIWLEISDIGSNCGKTWFRFWLGSIDPIWPVKCLPLAYKAKSLVRVTSCFCLSLSLPHIRQSWPGKASPRLVPRNLCCLSGRGIVSVVEGSGGLLGVQSVVQFWGLDGWFSVCPRSLSLSLCYAHGLCETTRCSWVVFLLFEVLCWGPHRTYFAGWTSRCEGWRPQVSLQKGIRVRCSKLAIRLRPFSTTVTNPEAAWSL